MPRGLKQTPVVHHAQRPPESATQATHEKRNRKLRRKHAQGAATAIHIPHRRISCVTSVSLPGAGSGPRSRQPWPMPWPCRWTRRAPQAIPPSHLGPRRNRPIRLGNNTCSTRAMEVAARGIPVARQEAAHAQGPHAHAEDSHRTGGSQDCMQDGLRCSLHWPLQERGV